MKMYCRKSTIIDIFYRILYYIGEGGRGGGSNEVGPGSRT